MCLPPPPRHRDPAVAHIPYAELHCHSNFSFLDGASPVEDLVKRALDLGLTGLAITDHLGLYGIVRFAAAAQEAGLRPIIGLEVELPTFTGGLPAGVLPVEGLPARPRPDRARLPGHRAPAQEGLRGGGERQRGAHLV